MPQISVETTIESVNQFLSKKMYVLALDVVSTALQENPNATELQALYGKVATESRDFYTAANVYDELVKKFPKHPVFLMDSAKAWSSVGETEKAILYSKRAIQYSNSSRQSVLALA
ncbi:MAG: tetratricopeptide repeat protein, partial [Phycisphaerales bacterium]